MTKRDETGKPDAYSRWHAPLSCRIPRETWCQRRSRSSVISGVLRHSARDKDLNRDRRSFEHIIWFPMRRQLSLSQTFWSRRGDDDDRRSSTRAYSSRALIADYVTRVDRQGCRGERVKKSLLGSGKIAITERIFPLRADTSLDLIS